MNSPSRPTPYGLAFPDPHFAERVLAAIRSEGEARGINLTDPSHFLQLGEVGLALQEMQGGGRGGDEVQGLGALLFQLFHFKRSGEVVLLLEKEEAKLLVGDGANQDGWRWTGAPPSPSGYLQLPRHLFWSAIDPTFHSPSRTAVEPASSAEVAREIGAAEAIDGIFWTASAGETLSLALISGVIDGRPGFTIFELPPVPIGDAHRWLDLRARAEGRDYATTLPGGELSGLHSIVALGEVLKLLVRTFAYFEMRDPRDASVRVGDIGTSSEVEGGATAEGEGG